MYFSNDHIQQVRSNTVLKVL